MVDKEMLNTVFNEECLNGMKRIPDNSIDMILCDLPYGTTNNKWDVIIPLDLLWEQYNRIIKERGAIVLTAQAPFDKKLGYSNLEMLKYEWIWVKNKPTGHLNSKRMPMKAHENILVFYKKQPNYNPQGLIKTDKHVIRKGCYNGSNYGESSKDSIRYYKNYPRDILYFDKDENGIHPTQKPVKLFEYLIKTYTNEGDIVMDNCMGSGTTAVACINTKRNYVGFELDSKYYDLCMKRIEDVRCDVRTD